MKWLVTLKKKNEDKCLVLDDVDKNKEVSKKYEEVCEDGKFYPQLFLDETLFELV